MFIKKGKEDETLVSIGFWQTLLMYNNGGKYNGGIKQKQNTS